MHEGTHANDAAASVRAKSGQFAKATPILALAVLAGCGGGDHDEPDGHKAIPVEPSASAAR